MKAAQSSFEKEEEHTIGKFGALTNCVGVSTASEEHSSTEDNEFHFSPAEVGGTMIGKTKNLSLGAFEADMLEEEFNSDDN